MLGNNMNLCAKGESSQVVPPGFRFHPTEEELLNYYLRKKLKSQQIDLDVIPDIDLNKLEPWDIREKCKIGSTMQNEWYLFSHKDKKYPTGTRTNRATASGFWKATGRDKVIYTNLKRIGMRKTLVFYTGRAPHGQKSDWIMHEYRLDGDNTSDSLNVLDISGESGPEEGWVVCRIFKKKKHQKALDGMSPPVSIPPNTLMHVQISSSREKQENESINSCREIIHNNNQYLPSESFQQLPVLNEIDLPMNPTVHNPSGWGAIDQLVASQLNGHNYFDEQLPGYVESIVNEDLLLSQDMDLWSFTRTSAPLTQASDPLSHLSV